MRYYTTRAFPTASRQYEAGDAIDPVNITAAEWIRGTESGAVVPARWYGTAAELAARGIPGPGVPVYETDTMIARVGDGVTSVASLPQVGSSTYAIITDVSARAVNASAYGLSAAATGAVNESALNNAQAACQASGAALFIPPGTFNVAPPSGEAALTVTMAGATPGLSRVFGAGPAATKLVVSTTDARGVDFGVWGTHFLEVDPLTVQDLTIQGPGKGVGTGVGIRGRNAAKGRISNVRSTAWGSHTWDWRNCNSTNLHNIRGDNAGGSGWFGTYTTSRDASDPGVGQAENNSANHACVFSGNNLFDDNALHGFEARAVFSLDFTGVCQRSGSSGAGRGMYLQDVRGIDLNLYVEANKGDGLKLGNSSGGAGTACTNARITLFAAKGATESANARNACWIYAGTGIYLTAYTGSYTGASDYAVYLETSFKGIISARHSGGSGKFIRKPDATDLAATDDVLTFGATAVV